MTAWQLRRLRVLAATVYVVCGHCGMPRQGLWQVQWVPDVAALASFGASVLAWCQWLMATADSTTADVSVDISVQPCCEFSGGFGGPGGTVVTWWRRLGDSYMCGFGASVSVAVRWYNG